MTLRLGTRRSELAMTQSTQVADQLRALGADVELVGIHSQGDVDHASLSQLGGVGVFAAALRLALLAGDCDLAVHSMKDLPTAPVPGLSIAAVPTRSYAHDVIICRDGLTLATLPAGATVGTGSPRRAAAILSVRPDITIVDIRGNVGTRLGRVKGYGGAEDLDAVVLAAAGLRRLGHDDADAEALPGLPAPAQGALAVEVRSDDEATASLVGQLDDPVTRGCVIAERAVLSGLQAGCAAPVGAFAQVKDGILSVTARVTSVDGSRHVETTEQRPWVADDQANQGLGLAAAQSLLAQGAATVTDLSASKPLRTGSSESRWGSEGPAPGVDQSSQPLIGRSIFMPRPPDDRLVAALQEAGANVHALPLTATTLAAPIDAECAQYQAGEFEWVIVTSYRSINALAACCNGHPYREDVDYQRLSTLLQAAPRTKFAALGSRTAAWLGRAGVTPDVVVAGHATAETFLERFATVPPTGRVWLPTSELSRDLIETQLTRWGWQVTKTDLYTTTPVDHVPDEIHAGWTMGLFDAAVILAASGADAAATLLGQPHETTSIVAFGEPSAKRATANGLRVSAVAGTQDATGLIDALIAATTQSTQS